MGLRPGPVPARRPACARGRQRALEVGAEKPRALEVGASEHRALQVGALELRVLEVGEGEPRAVEALDSRTWPEPQSSGVGSAAPGRVARRPTVEAASRRGCEPVG
jgi:hypothetical protein